MQTTAQKRKGLRRFAASHSVGQPYPLMRAGSYQSSKSMAVTSRTITIPNTAQAGDLMIVRVFRSGNTGTLAVNTGTGPALTNCAGTASINTGVAATEIKGNAYYARLVAGDVDGTKTIIATITVSGFLWVSAEFWSNPHPSTAPQCTPTQLSASATLTTSAATIANGFVGKSYGFLGIQSSATAFGTLTSSYTGLENYVALNGAVSGSPSGDVDYADFSTNPSHSVTGTETDTWSWSSTAVVSAAFDIAVPGPGTTLFAAVTAYMKGKGPWTQLLASTAFTADGVMLSVNPSTLVANGGDVDLVFDLATGGVGSEVVLVPDIRIHAIVSSTTNFGSLPTTVWIPCIIPGGSRLSVRGFSGTSTVSPISLQVSASIGG